MEGQIRSRRAGPPKDVLALLPDGWRLDGGPALDLDEAIESGEAPPLSMPECLVTTDLVAVGFTAMAEGWAEWLLEAGRLLAEDGIAVVGLAERGALRAAHRRGLGRIPDRDDGARRDEETPRTAVFHSEWWLRSHWGRAFGRVELLERDGLRHALLSQPVGGITAEELERPAEGDERELAAASANAAYLRSQLDLLAKRHRHQLAELREETGRELMRRSFAAADLEWARRGPGSPATLAAAEYEATTSWRVTRPLRALGAMVRRLR